MVWWWWPRPYLTQNIPSKTSTELNQLQWGWTRTSPEVERPQVTTKQSGTETCCVLQVTGFLTQRATQFLWRSHSIFSHWAGWFPVWVIFLSCLVNLHSSFLPSCWEVVCLLCTAKSLPYLLVFLLPRCSQHFPPQCGRKNHNFKKRKKEKCGSYMNKNVSLYFLHTLWALPGYQVSSSTCHILSHLTLTTLIDKYLLLSSVVFKGK